MRAHRLLSASLLAAAIAACGAEPAPDATIEVVAQPLSVKKTFTRKIYVHVMPWFEVGGLHWSMNARNGATGVASWYSPLIGEYSSNDPVVIEYQLLTMKYAGIDGVLIDWPGLNGANDLPRNKAAAEALINRTAAFGLEFGIVYEDQNAVSVDAARNDLSYARDNYFSKPNYIKVNGQPALLVFGPQKLTNPADWTNVLSGFANKPALFTLWYNQNAGSNATGQFAWIAQNGLKGVADFDDGLDGGNHGLTIPVLYPGFNPYYAAGGWPGPTWKVSYSLKPDNTEGGDTFSSTFQLGMYAGDPLQIATWNDYGEGTMVEPTQQFQYRFLTTLQQNVGATYTDAELKIVKLLYDQRRQSGGAKQAELDRASTALASLDVATACGILGCAVPMHGGSGGAGGAGTTGSAGAGGAGTTGSVGAGGAAGSKGAAGTSGTAGAGVAGAGGTTAGAAGHAGSGGGVGGGAGAASTGGQAGGGHGGQGATKASSGCSVTGTDGGASPLGVVGLAGLALISRRRRRGISRRTERCARAPSAAR